MKEDEIDLTVENNTLTIRGEKNVATDVAEDQFHRMNAVRVRSRGRSRSRRQSMLAR